MPPHSAETARGLTSIEASLCVCVLAVAGTTLKPVEPAIPAIQTFLFSLCLILNDGERR